MLRLVRVTFFVIVANALCIAIVIAAHYSESRWDCLNYTDANNMRSIFDIEHGVYFTENRLYPSSENLYTVYNMMRAHDRLYYEAASILGVHRIGTVTRTAAPFLDYAESSDFIARSESLPNDQKYLPILTYDRLTQTQTITIYDVPTLTPLISSVQTGIDLIRAPQGNYERTPAGWSSKGTWFALLSRKSNGVELRLLSPSRNLSRSFTFAGVLTDAPFIWSLTERALAVVTENNYFASLLVAEDDDWSSVKTYQVQASNTGVQLRMGYWSIDDRSFYFVEPTVDSSTKLVLKVFRLDTERIDLAEAAEQIDWNGLRLKDQWLCRINSNRFEGALISLTSAHAPIPIASLTLNQDACDPIMQSPDASKVVVGTYTSSEFDVGWLGVTADPFTITALTLPPTTFQVIGWSPDSQWALFFVPNTQTTNDDHDGWVGILDTTTWQWKLVNEAIAIDQYIDIQMPQAFSPDASRFLMLAADRQHTLVLDRDGQLVNTLELPVSYPYINVNWSPDSTTFMLTDNRPQIPLEFYVFTRDGQLLRRMYNPRLFERWLSEEQQRGWTRCDPSVKLPHMYLP